MPGMARYQDPCPTCFIEKGYSIILNKKEDGTYVCPQDSSHKFRKNEEGYYKPI